MRVVNNGGQCGAARPGRLGHRALASCSAAIISSLAGREKLGDAARCAEKPSEKPADVACQLDLTKLQL